MLEPTRVLIVEDEAIIAMDLRETLHDAGYLVVATVASGEEALLLCSGEKPDLVLMDVQLEGALNGITTAQRLRENYGIPSVLLTAHYDPVTLAAAQEAGVFAYLIKPYDQRELCATLATALARARSERELNRQLQELRISPATPKEDNTRLKIFTLCSPLTIEFQGRIVSGNHFPRTQREMLALLLSAPMLRMDREALEAELWPESPAKQSRASLDSTLGRMRKLFNTLTESTAAGEIFTLRNGMVGIENCTIDLHRFIALDEEGMMHCRNCRENEAIATFSQALALWKGEFLGTFSSHHNILTVRQHNTQRAFEVAHWLAEAFAARQRSKEQIMALRVALRAIPGSEQTATTLYTLLLSLDRLDLGKELLKDFTRSLIHEGMERSKVTLIVQRIEKYASFKRYLRTSTV